MAVAMRFVRIEPDAPTIVRDDQRGVVDANTVAAADRPVKALSIEITTGICTSDREHDRVAEQRRADEQTDEDDLGVVAAGDVGAHGDGEDEQHEVDDLLGRAEADRAPGMISWSLPNAMSTPRRTPTR